MSKWRQLARLLDLNDCLLECQKGAAGRRRRRGCLEKDNMEVMLKAWKNKYPESYNILNLKSILLAEVLLHVGGKYSFFTIRLRLNTLLA